MKTTQQLPPRYTLRQLEYLQAALLAATIVFGFPLLAICDPAYAELYIWGLIAWGLHAFAAIPIVAISRLPLRVPGMPAFLRLVTLHLCIYPLIALYIAVTLLIPLVTNLPLPTPTMDRVFPAYTCASMALSILLSFRLIRKRPELP